MSGVLDGKVVIVTGAAGGIGEGYAHAISEAGAQVVVADLDEGGAKRVAEEIRRHRAALKSLSHNPHMAAHRSPSPPRCAQTETDNMIWRRDFM